MGSLCIVKFDQIFRSNCHFGLLNQHKTHQKFDINRVFHIYTVCSKCQIPVSGNYSKTRMKDSAVFCAEIGLFEPQIFNDEQDAVNARTESQFFIN